MVLVVVTSIFYFWLDGFEDIVQVRYFAEIMVYDGTNLGGISKIMALSTLNVVYPAAPFVGFFGELVFAP